MTNLSRIKKIITVLILAVALLFSGLFFLPTNFARVKAETPVDITSSSVRDDLESMDMYKPSYVSETENLFITMSQYYDKENKLRSYLYLNLCQTPTLKYKVLLSISVMDSNFNINENYKLYSLALINNDSTLYKFEIEGLENLEETTRRYNIKSVGYLTGEIDNSYFAFLYNVDQTFIYNGITNDRIQVFHQEVQTITITEKEVGFFCYGQDSPFFDFFRIPEVMKVGNFYTDCWFIFFNTDKRIDKLLEVEITFTKYEYSVEEVFSRAYMNTAYTIDYLEEREKEDSVLLNWGPTKYIESSSQSILIEPGKIKVSSSDNVWFANYDTYYRDLDKIIDLRIYSSENDSGNPFCFEKQKKKYTWGVNFLNTSKTCSLDGASLGGSTPTETKRIVGFGVSDVAILRLKFMIDGITKNCYAVDTPTDDFFGESAVEDDDKYLMKILALIALVLICVVLGPYISPVITIVLQFLGKFLGWLFRSIWFVISFKWLRKSSSTRQDIPKRRKRKR